MKTIDIESWEEFSPTVEKELQSLDGPRSRQILFRGHSDSKWNLETTLERRSKAEFTIRSYALRATRYAFELRSLTGHRWDTPSLPELEKELEERQSDATPFIPCYSYLAYLRHHGFASPLLDWTKSKFVAAFFAFSEPLLDESGRVAVFVYAEAPSGIKRGVIGAPMIHVQGPFVDTDQRHFSQQAWYSICTKWDQEKSSHIFCSYASVFEGGAQHQDVLVKITIPRSERKNALKFLDEVNINHYTLFHSEDSLVKTMETREFDILNG